MTLVMGIDEAGYGPNLGPLCIGLSAWEVAEEAGGERRKIGESPAAVDLFSLLEPVVSRGVSPDRLAIADSKLLYKPGGGIGTLECGVLAMLSLVDRPPAACWDSLVDALAADDDGYRHQLPWHANGFNPAVPHATSVERLDESSTELRRDLPDRVALRTLAARMVYPAEFNASCRQHGSKGRALSGWTLQLVREAIDRITPAPSPQSPPIQVTCDKHGGRNSYAGLLSEFFPEYTIRVVVESRPRSEYLLRRDEVDIRIEFRSKGESQLETALASMVAKYLRELSMHAFNQFWQSHLPQLKPTAGYPMDAKRFKADIEVKQRELTMDDDLLWRIK